MRTAMLAGAMVMVFSGAALAQSWKPPSDAERCPSKWGGQDQRGSANLMTPEKVLRAARLIRTGEVIELDRRYPYTGLLVYAREAAIADGVDITTVEVREDDGRVIPYTANWLDAQMENQHMLDLEAVEQGVALRTDAGTIDTLVSRILHADVHLEDDTGAPCPTRRSRLSPRTASP